MTYSHLPEDLLPSNHESAQQFDRQESEEHTIE